MNRVIRHLIPADDATHGLGLNGAILHVATRLVDAVEVWTLDSGGPTTPRTFLVVGTGHPWPDGDWTHVGTAIIPGGVLVWHLLERRS